MKLLAEGKSVKEAATEFNLSVKTVEAHKFNLMRKLDIHNKAQLVQYAIQKQGDTAAGSDGGRIAHDCYSPPRRQDRRRHRVFPATRVSSDTDFNCPLF